MSTPSSRFENNRMFNSFLGEDDQNSKWHLHHHGNGGIYLLCMLCK